MVAEEMEKMEMIQLHWYPMKLDRIPDLHINSFENDIAIQASIKKLVIMELVYAPKSTNIFPFRFSYIQVPQERTLSPLVKRVTLPDIYRNSTVQQCHQLSMEPIYVNESNVEELKPKVICVNWAPKKQKNNMVVIALLSSYGVLEIYARTGLTSRDWSKIPRDINEFLMSNIFPLMKSLEDIKNFPEFKETLDLYWITAFAWAPVISNYIIYIGNAAGYIVGLELTDDLDDIREYCKFQTNLGQINYIKAFGNLLLVSSIQGIINLYKIVTNDANGSTTITEASRLWRRADRMACKKAEVTYSNATDSYLVIFAKGSHLLAYRVSADGELLCSAQLYVNDIKITDVVTLDNESFIITTVTGRVRHVWVTGSKINGLQLHEQMVKVKFNERKYQILAATASTNKGLWYFVLYRNQQYKDYWKQFMSTIFISVNKLKNVDLVQKLTSSPINVMDNYLDYASSLQMEAQQHAYSKKLRTFFEFTTLKMPHRLDDLFMQRLQIKLLIIKATIKYHGLQLKYVIQLTALEQSVLQKAIEVIHIMRRLQYVEELVRVKDGGDIPVQLTDFQSLSALCMISKFHILINELTEISNGENPLRHTIKKFVELAVAQMNTETLRSSIDASKFSEKCNDCGCPIEFDTLMCNDKHITMRCSISSIQMTVFTPRICRNCIRFALKDGSLLQQLYPSNEVITCIFCRFSFSIDENCISLV